MNDLSLTDRRHELAECKRTLAGCDETLGVAAWDWGSALARIDALELWREDDAATFTAWLDTELAISRASALRAMALARHFTREMAGRFGGRKLAAAMVYTELTTRAEQPGDILATDLRLRGPKGTFISVPFVTATARQVEAACETLREATAARAEKTRAKEISADVRAEVADLAARLPAAPPKSVRGERVELVRAADGSTAVTVRGLPLETFKAFSAWLAAQNRG